MKRKDLYNYIREEIINELSEVDPDKTRGTVVMSKTTNPADVKKWTTQGVDVELKELARKAKGLKPGKNIEDVKSIYTTSMAAKVLELVENAGEDGITIKEIAEVLGIKDTAQINPLIRELEAIGAIAKGDVSVEEPTITKPEAEKEKEDEEEFIEKDEEEEKELDSDDEETDKEEEETAKEFEKEPSSADLAAAEKTLGVAGKEAEINKAISIIKTLTDKIEKLSGTEREVKLKALKQYVNNNKSLLRGIDLDIITNGLIS